MAPGEGKSTEPGGAGRGSPAPAGKADPAGFWPAKSWDSLFPEPIARRKVPRRRKAPDFSNSDVQRATLAIHSLGLVCVFFLFYVIFCCCCFSVFALSAPTETAAAARPGAVGKGAPSLSPSAAPRQRCSPARTCPEVSGAGNDAGLLRGSRTDAAGAEQTSGDAPSRDSRPGAVRKDSSSCKIDGFRSLE